MKPSRAVTSGATAQADELVLMRWLRDQIKKRSGAPAGSGLATPPGFGELYAEMRFLGEQLRQASYTSMLHGRHVDPRTAPDTSRTSLMNAAGRDVLHIEILARSDPNMTPDNVLFSGPRPPFAYIQIAGMAPNMRPRKPILHVINAPDGLRHIMFFDMACVLGRFVKDLALYHGGVADTILPPDPQSDKNLTAVVHAFARAFLRLGTECPTYVGCQCYAVQMELAHVPDGALPQPTVPTSTQALRYEIARQTTPPNGIRWQAWREQQLKKTDQQLRGLTPPPESGEL